MKNKHYFVIAILVIFISCNGNEEDFETEAVPKTETKIDVLTEIIASKKVMINGEMFNKYCSTFDRLDNIEHLQERPIQAVTQLDYDYLRLFAVYDLILEIDSNDVFDTITSPSDNTLSYWASQDILVLGTFNEQIEFAINYHNSHFPISEEEMKLNLIEEVALLDYFAVTHGSFTRYSNTFSRAENIKHLSMVRPDNMTPIEFDYLRLNAVYDLVYEGLPDERFDTISSKSRDSLHVWIVDKTKELGDFNRQIERAIEFWESQGSK
ncbi:MAG: hypothetical protein ACI8Q1_001977 [Parvicella sp.]|jgi:hypothetical protein